MSLTTANAQTNNTHTHTRVCVYVSANQLQQVGALLLYAHMAEMGYEVAQANAAVLLEEASAGLFIDCCIYCGC